MGEEPLRTRIYAAAAALSLASLTGGGAALAAASPASASPAAPGPVRSTGLTTTAPCTVAGVTGTQTCSVAVTGFQVVNGALQASGTVTAPVGTVLSNGTNVATFTAQVLDPTACQLVSLTLGPLHLDVLGLVVDIPNPVVLNVTAQPGPGNLLGNLLCSVTGLLNNNGNLGNAVTNLLNTINGILAGL